MCTRALGLIVMLMSACLTACGGGDNSGPSTSFTLNASSANFTAIAGGTDPAPQIVTIHVTGDTSAGITADFPDPANPPQWLVPTVSGSGTTRTLRIAASARGEPVAQYSLTLHVRAKSATGELLHEELLTVTLNALARPTLTVTPTTLSFGGADGRQALSAAPITFNLGGSTKAYPFSISTTTGSGGSWLTVDKASGSVDNGAQSVHASVNTQGLRGGTYGGQIAVTVDAEGTAIVETLGVTLNLEASRLVVTAEGIGLSQLPGRSVLSRTVQVLSNLGRSDIPWKASSDSPWVAVTPFGTTGGDLVITADTSGQPLDTTLFATVTIRSPDATVENRQSVRVGLYVSNTAAVTTALAIDGKYIAASPVEPLVGISPSGTDVSLYNVYTGALVRTLSSVAAVVGGLQFAEDGRTLFVFDNGNNVVNQVDLQAATRLAAYDIWRTPPSPISGGGTTFLLMHPDGYDSLVTAVGQVYDLTSGAQYIDPKFIWSAEALSFAASPDQSLIATQVGIANRIRRSALNGGSLITEAGVVAPPAGIVQNPNNGQSCFSTTGDRIYTASGAPYNFPATSVATSQVIQTLPGNSYPDAILCVWNGLVIGGIDGYYDPTDIFIYQGSSATPLGQLSSDGTSSAYRDLQSRGMVVSADGTMLLTSWASLAGPGIYFQSLPAPP